MAKKFTATEKSLDKIELHLLSQNYYYYYYYWKRHTYNLYITLGPAVRGLFEFRLEPKKVVKWNKSISFGVFRFSIAFKMARLR